MALPTEHKGLDPKDLKLLAIINRKPYKKYQPSDLLAPSKRTLTLSEEVDRVDELQSLLIRLVKRGLIKEQTFYASLKAKL